MGAVLSSREDAAVEETALSPLLHEEEEEELGSRVEDVHTHVNDTSKLKGLTNESDYVRCTGFDADGKAEAESSAKRRLVIAVSVAMVFLVLEAVGGVLANSLAVLTDAAHIFSDVGGLVLSLFAMHVSRRKPTELYTYGFYRSETIAALVSMMMIWACTAALVVEAIQRLRYVFMCMYADFNFRVEVVVLVIASLCVFLVRRQRERERERETEYVSVCERVG